MQYFHRLGQVRLCVRHEVGEMKVKRENRECNSECVLRKEIQVLSGCLQGSY